MEEAYPKDDFDPKVYYQLLKSEREEDEYPVEQVHEKCWELFHEELADQIPESVWEDRYAAMMKQREIF